MTPYTLPINRSETQVLDLIKRAQTIQRSLLLTVDGDPEPVVVVLEKNVYEQSRHPAGKNTRLVTFPLFWPNTEPNYRYSSII